MERTYRTACDACWQRRGDLDTAQRLRLYAWYKQAQGTDAPDTCAARNNVERAKWYAWRQRRGATREAAMRAYVALAKSLRVIS